MSCVSVFDVVPAAHHVGRPATSGELCHDEFVGNGVVVAERPESAVAPPGRLRQRLLDPRTEPTHLFAPVLALVTLGALSTPGWDVLLTQICLAGWLVLVVVCFAGLAQKLRNERRGRPDERALWTFMVVPALALMVVAAALTEAPVRFRFALGDEQMTAQAQRYLDDPGAPLGYKIGSFPIERVSRERNAVYYVVGNGGSDDEYGFVYSPNGPPVSRRGDRFLHLGGAWYLWYANSSRLLLF
ncbi:MAG: hypothetical protein N2037_10535 [Acidimicrobiales bacterium]|nr:hypothetical protein [Acidimicrobiales bacterium]